MASPVTTRSTDASSPASSPPSTGGHRARSLGLVAPRTVGHEATDHEANDHGVGHLGAFHGVGSAAGDVLRPLPPENPLDRARAWLTRLSVTGASPRSVFGLSAGADTGGRTGPADEGGLAVGTGGSGRPDGRRTVLAVVGLVAVLAIGWWLLRPPAPPLETTLPLTEPVSSTDGANPAEGGSAGSAGAAGQSGGAGVSVEAQQAPQSLSGGASGAAASSAPPVTLVVHASGAVASPGVYRLDDGSRVDDLIRAAGGVTPDGDADRVNLAAPLADGERVWVPRRGDTEIPEVVAGAGAASVAGAGSGSGETTDGDGSGVGEVIDLNSADAEELEALPGVGPATAAAIVAHRDQHGPFTSVDELLDVRGIGEAKLEQIRPLART